MLPLHPEKQIRQCVCHIARRAQQCALHAPCDRLSKARQVAQALDRREPEAVVAPVGQADWASHEPSHLVLDPQNRRCRTEIASFCHRLFGLRLVCAKSSKLGGLLSASRLHLILRVRIPQSHQILDLLVDRPQDCPFRRFIMLIFI